MNLFKNKFLLHVAFILIFIIYEIFTIPFIDINTVFNNPLIVSDLIYQILLIVVFYINYFYLIEKFYLQKKHIIYFITVIIVFILILIIENLSINYFYDLNQTNFEHFEPPFYPHKPKFMFWPFDKKLHLYLIIVLIALIIKVRVHLRQVEIEKTNYELSNLKAQINPHFLFNALNSIYSLAIQNSNKTADSIIKLSEIMRYVLRDNSLKIKLEEELNFINHYLELQKMRLTSNVNFIYEINGKPENQNIEPLIFIPLIENAFKYGISTIENSNIYIKFNIEKEKINLEIKNTIVSNKTHNTETTKIGLNNVKKRLKLLYPNKHQLVINCINNEFIINLNIIIND
ncbi:MAG: sensor histidine kinase [Bacteroidetes bacterium]|nr:sensor histidine kinase [Bacteroidota bacterium]